MVEVDKQISSEEESLLKTMVGTTLLYLEAKIVAPPDMAWNVVRLHTTGGALDVRCLLRNLPINDEGDEEEFGLISVAESEGGALSIPGVSADVFRIDVGKIVTGIEVVNDRMGLFESGEEIYRRTTTKAIVVHVGEEVVCLDRPVWFDEMLSIGRGPSLKGLITDEWADWEDDEEEEPGIHYEFSVQHKLI